MRKIALLFAFVFAVAYPGGIPFKGSLPLQADYSLFYDTLELFYEIPCRELVFIKEQALFRASYEVALFSSHGGNDFSFVGKARKDVCFSDYRATRDPKGMVRDKLFFPLPPHARYVSLVFKDLNSDRISSALFRLKEKEGLFLMKGTKVCFDEEWTCEDTLSLSLRVSSPARGYLVSLKKGRKVVKTCTLWPTPSGIAFSQPLREIPGIADDTSGTYTLKVTPLEGGRVMEFPLFIRVSPYLSDKEWKRKVSLLFPIATEEERERLSAVAPEKRRDAWEKFWQERDEKEEEYFAKVDYCVKNFSRGDKGVFSDRAKIYLKYGPPDAIEEYPYESDRKPTLIWHYYSLGKRFVFVDLRGTGEYKLVRE